MKRKRSARRGRSSSLHAANHRCPTATRPTRRKPTNRSDFHSPSGRGASDQVRSTGWGNAIYPLGSILSLFQPPLSARDILTQPPQKRIRFGVRYEYSPGTRRYFTLHNEAGIRFGDLVEFFEREPGMIKQAVNPNVGLGRYRRWLRDADFIWMNRLEWEVERGVVKGEDFGGGRLRVARRVRSMST